MRTATSSSILRRSLSVTLLIAFLLVSAAGKAQGRIEFKWYGLYTVLDYSYAINLNDNVPRIGEGGRMSFSEITGIVGFQIRKETGVGLGFTCILDPADGYTQMPMYIELRSHYLRSRLTPFTVLKLGYAMPMGESSVGNDAITINHGGVFMGAEIGGRFAVSNGFAVNIHAGYQMILMSEVEYVHNNLLAQREPVQFHVVHAGVGINF